MAEEPVQLHLFHQPLHIWYCCYVFTTHPWCFVGGVDLQLVGWSEQGLAAGRRLSPVKILVTCHYIEIEI